MFTRSRILRLTGKKRALRFIAPVLLIGYRPPTSTSRPPDVIHMIGVPRPSPFFALFSFMYYTERKPKNKKRGRPGNKASNEVGENKCATATKSWKWHEARPSTHTAALTYLWSIFYPRNSWTLSCQRHQILSCSSLCEYGSTTLELIHVLYM